MSAKNTNQNTDKNEKGIDTSSWLTDHRADKKALIWYFNGSMKSVGKVKAIDFNNRTNFELYDIYTQETQYMNDGNFTMIKGKSRCGNGCPPQSAIDNINKELERIDFMEKYSKNAKADLLAEKAEAEQDLIKLEEASKLEKEIKKLFV